MAADIRITPGASVMTFLSISGYTETLTQTDTGELNLYGVGESGRDGLFSIDGSNGRLFTVTDDLSDSLFSVNTIAGLPVMEVFADNSVKIGQYGYDVFNISNNKVGIGTSTPSHMLEIIDNVSDYVVSIKNDHIYGHGLYIRAGDWSNSRPILDLYNNDDDNNVFSFWSDGYANLGTASSTITVNGLLYTQYFTMTNGATDGYYLRSDAFGNGTWAAVSASQVYKGTWNASTNTPQLRNNSGGLLPYGAQGGWYYRCIVAGTQNFGAGSITFSAGDDVMYNSTSGIWERIPSYSSLPNATKSTIGGVIVGAGLNVSSGTISVNSSSSNNANTIVARDGFGRFTASIIKANSFEGAMSGVLSPSNGIVLSANYNGSANVTISTNATDLNTYGTIVARNGSGNFSAGIITATLNGSADKLDDLHGYNYVYSNNAVNGDAINWNAVSWPADNKITISQIAVPSYTSNTNYPFYSYGSLITFGSTGTSFPSQFAIGYSTNGIKYRCQESYSATQFNGSWRSILTTASTTNNNIQKISYDSINLYLTVVDSIISDDGTTVTIGGSLTVNNNLNIKGQAYSEIHSNVAVSTIDFNNGNIQTLSLTSSITIILNNAVGGGTYTLIITQGGNGGYSITWPGNTKWPDGYKPYLSSAVGDVDIITFVSDGTTLYGIPQYNFKI